jgi:formylglycine-generating enzyme required for sulfatase activity
MSVKDWRPNPITDVLPDGTRIEQWFHQGLLHRVDAPARIETWPEGIHVERWYEAGKLLASVMTAPDGERTVDEAGIIEVPLPGGISMAFIRIPPGTFMMGSEEYDDEKPVHQITLTRGLWLAATQTTQAQWRAVTGKNPSYFKGNADLPVEQVSWQDCMKFVGALASAAPEGLQFDLPTEAEWEYACRADSTTAWSFGDHESGLDDYAWFYGNSDGKTHPVGQKRPNAWGLYDMHGNVWEWCRDWYGRYKAGPVRDPQGPRSGEYRILRGGSWAGDPRYTRSAIRYRGVPSYRGYCVGMRAVLR